MPSDAAKKARMCETKYFSSGVSFSQSTASCCAARAEAARLARWRLRPGACAGRVVSGRASSARRAARRAARGARGAADAVAGARDAARGASWLGQRRAAGALTARSISSAVQKLASAFLYISHTSGYLIGKSTNRCLFVCRMGSWASIGSCSYSGISAGGQGAARRVSRVGGSAQLAGALGTRARRRVAACARLGGCGPASG